MMVNFGGIVVPPCAHVAPPLLMSNTLLPYVNQKTLIQFLLKRVTTLMPYVNQKTLTQFLLKRAIPPCVSIPMTTLSMTSNTIYSAYLHFHY